MIMQRLPSPNLAEVWTLFRDPLLRKRGAGRKAIADVVVVSGTVAHERLTASLHKKNEVFTAKKYLSGRRNGDLSYADVLKTLFFSFCFCFLK